MAAPIGRGLCRACTSANAALIEIDDPVFAPDSLTRGTDVGLEWLDVTITVGLSYNDVSIELGPSGDYEGFRYADRDEVGSLFWRAGIDAISGPPPNTSSYAGELLLQTLVGETTPTDYGALTLAVTGTWYLDGKHFGALINRSADLSETASAETFEYNMRDDLSGAYGHWLVRPIPEPGAGLLLIGGLLGLGMRRRASA